MRRFLVLLIELLAALVGTTAVTALGLLWWLSAHPVSSTILTPYVEQALDGELPAARVKIQRSLLSWDNKNHALALYAEGLTMREPAGTVIAEIPKLDIHLSLFALLVGRVEPAELTLEQPQLRLVREPDGSFTFGGRQAANVPGTAPEPDGENWRQKAARLADDLRNSPLLRKLQITQGQVVIHDAGASTDWTLTIPAVILKHNSTALNGHLSLAFGPPEASATAALVVSYDKPSGRYQLTATLAQLDPAQLAGGHPESFGLQQATAVDLPISGTLAARLDQQFNLQGVQADLHAGHGTLTVPAVWPQPRVVDSIDLRGSVDMAAKTLNVPKLAIDFGGPTLAANLTGAPSTRPGDDIDFTATAALANWPMDGLGNLLPKSAASGARDWMAANLTQGMFDTATTEVKGSLAFAKPADAEITSLTGKASASHGRVQYLAGFPPGVDASATASFDLQHASITITGGTVSGLQALPFTLTITGLDQADQAIEIPVHLAGPMPAALKLIDMPPLGYAKALGLKPGDVSGDMDGIITLKFPLESTLAFKDVGINADVHLTNAASSALIKGIAITQGDLDLAITKTALTAKGNAALNSVPMQIDWQENFASVKGQPLRQATITGIVNGDQWQAFGIPTTDRIRGATRIAIQLTAPGKHHTILTGSADLTAPGISVPELNYTKPANAPTQLAFAADLTDGKDIQLKSMQLRGPQLTAIGTASLTAAGKLKALDFSTLRVGRTDAVVHFDQTADGSQHIAANGAALDIAGVLHAKATTSPSQPIPQTFQIKIAKLYTSETGFFLNAAGSAERDRQGWQTADFTSQPDGTHNLLVQLQKQPDGTHTLLVTCDDFGATLQAFGFSNALAGGDLKIAGNSTAEEPDIITGTAKLGPFDVKNLPLLVLLLNATSPLGFTNILSDRVSFDHLRGTFRWEGEKVELVNINASGSAIGITASGVLDTQSGQGQLHGTLVPFSLVNRALEAIPLLGDILTGGDHGGVIAATYKIQGKLDKPEISVNPVSLLTPGFLRNLFFGGGANAEDDKELAEPEPTVPPANKTILKPL